jgi:Ser-Thr-rich glycosyl-phosphatidyl-inositol-anchored membrane family
LPSLRHVDLSFFLSFFLSSSSNKSAMHFLSLGVSILCILPSIIALTITSPTPGSTIDPSQAFVITWTSTSSDPSTIEFNIHETNPAVLATDQVLANGVATSAHSFIVPANTVQQFGTGFVIQALSGGSVIATSGAFALAAGNNAVSTLSNGQETFVSITTVVTNTPAATTTATPLVQTTSAPGVTSSVGASATTAVVPVTGAAPTGVVTGTETATGTQVLSTSVGESGAATSSVSGLVTSTTIVGTTSSSTAAASATSKAFAHGNARVGVVALAGGVMGAVALLV